MKKARTLLAIWLALILTLTLFPTALATGDGGAGGTLPEPAEVQVIWGYDSDQVEIVSGQVKTIPANEDFLFSFKAKEGYKITDLQILLDDTDFGNSMPGQNEDGSFPYKISASALTNVKALTIKIFSEKIPQEQNNDPTPTTPDNGNPDSSPQALPYTITFKATVSTKLIENWPEHSAWATGTDGKLTLPNDLSLSNHTFKGWYNEAEKEFYPKGEQATQFSKDATVTARFDRNFIFQFAGLEGANPSTLSRDPAATDETITLPSAPTKSGKVFRGWTISGDGIPTTLVAAGETYTLPSTAPAQGKETLTITATWADTPKIAINYARGDAPANASMPANTSVEKAASGATSFTLDKKTPSRNDNSMVFDYYTANVDLGDPDGKYAPGQTVSIPEGTTSVTLTAHWYKKYYADDGNDDRPSKPSKPTYDEYRIRATCSDGGWVSPAGSSYVREGRNLTVTFAPYKGYAIDGVYIDGVLDNRYDGSYTFRDVDENHTIYVRYVRDSGSSGGSSGGGSHWDDNTSPKTGDASAPLSMGLGVGSLALIAFLVARKMRRA